MISLSQRAVLGAVLTFVAAAPAAALEFRDSHFGPDACYVRAEQPSDNAAPRPNRQWATISIEEDTESGAAGDGQMAVSLFVSGGSGSQARQLPAICTEGDGSLTCEVGRDRGRFTLAPQGEDIVLSIEEINMPGQDGNRQGLTRILSERGVGQSFVLVPAEAPSYCLR